MAANPQHYDLHGIRMTEEAFERLISVESPYRYELIDGIVYDMTGSTPEHSVIASNIEMPAARATRRAWSMSHPSGAIRCDPWEASCRPGRRADV